MVHLFSVVDPDTLELKYCFIFCFKTISIHPEINQTWFYPVSQDQTTTVPTSLSSPKISGPENDVVLWS